MRIPTLAAHRSAVVREHIKIPVENTLADELDRNDCSLFQLWLALERCYGSRQGLTPRGKIVVIVDIFSQREESPDRVVQNFICGAQGLRGVSRRPGYRERALTLCTSFLDTDFVTKSESWRAKIAEPRWPAGLTS